MAQLLDGVHVAVVTVSDRCASGERADETGPLLAHGFGEAGATVSTALVADDVAQIGTAITSALGDDARAVITTGGTGIGPRDVTPEAVAPFLARGLPGVAELLRQRDAARTPLVALSRETAGVTAGPSPAVIVTLPGSPSAVVSALEVLPAILAHAIAQLDGGDH